MKSNANRPLPRTIDDITPEWFTSALTIGGVLAGEAVTEVEIERIGFMEGFMGVHARLTPQYDGPAQKLPSTLIAKLPDLDPAQRSAQSSAFKTEAGYYSAFPADDTTVHPRCYFAGRNPGMDDHVLLIEDLSRGRSASMIRNMPPADASTVLTRSLGSTPNTGTRLTSMPWTGPWMVVCPKHGCLPKMLTPPPGMNSMTMGELFLETHLGDSQKVEDFPRGCPDRTRRRVRYPDARRSAAREYVLL